MAKMKKSKRNTAQTLKSRAPKRGPYRNVSAALNLPRLEKSTPSTCMKRAREIEGLIKRGKVPKAYRATAQQWVYKYKARARALKAA